MNNLNLTLNITQMCNLGCRYCYINQKNKRMSWNTAKQAIDFIMGLNKDRNIIVSFTTAEPLLEWELIKKIVKYSEGKGVKRFDMATNGILISKDKLDYCVKHNIVLQLSFDGIKRIHDNIRLNKYGRPTSEILHEKLVLIRKYYRNHLEVRVTVTPENVEYLYDSVNYLTSNRFSEDMRINIVPVVNQAWSKKHLASFKKMLFEIAGLFLERYNAGETLNICSSECFPKQFHLLNIAKYKDSEAMFCNVGHGIISVDSDGKIWPCYWVGSTSYKQKDILALGDVKKRHFDPDKIGLIGMPKKNTYLSCRAWNFLINQDSNKPLPINREIFKIWLSASCFVNNNIIKG